MFSLLFTFISLVLLVQFVVYLTRGSTDPLIAVFIFAGFLACLIPALRLLKPFDLPEDARRRREERRRKMEERRGWKDDERR